MAAVPLIRLLHVNANPEISKALTLYLGGARPRYRSENAASRTGFFEALDRRRPDLIVVGEGGIPGLALKEIFEIAQKRQPGIPVVVLGDRREEGAALRLLRRGASEYLRVAEMDRLPSVIERSLREQRTRTSQLHLQDEMRRAAILMQENQRLVTIGRLAGSIAHEINNPLEAVINLLFLIGQVPELPPVVRDYLASAQGEVDRVVEISKQTLNFYREAPVPIPVRLSGLVEEVLVLYSRKIAEKNLEVVRQFHSEEPVVALPGEMRQVFSNLIGNAIEASAWKGKLQLRVRKSRLWRDPGVVGLRVTIADNGAGMPPEVRRRIGEPFFTTKGQAGTGLGLWVTRSIVRRYGGSLLLRSATGRNHGTVFSVFLPTNLRPRAVGSSAESAAARTSFLNSERTSGGGLVRPQVRGA